MIDLSTLQGLTIPEGVVTQIESGGKLLWKRHTAKDPLVDENTLLLLMGEEIKDSSLHGNATTNKLVEIGSGQGVLGSSAMVFDGNSARMYSGNLLAGNIPFTVETWVKLIGAKNHTIWSHGGSNAPAISGGALVALSSGDFCYYCSGFLIQGGSYVLNEWVHVALVGDQVSTRMYVNGVKVGQNDQPYNFGSYIEDIGANASAYGGESVYANENLHGYIDEFRISNIARYTDNFDPVKVGLNTQAASAV